MKHKHFLLSLLILPILLAACLGTPGSLAPGLLDITFSQLDWYRGDGSLQLDNSLWGMVTWTYEADPEEMQFFNLAVGLVVDVSPIWVVQNLPLYGGNDDLLTLREATYFDLSELGISEGMSVTELYFSASISDSVQNAAPAGNLEHADVPTLAYHSCELIGEPVGQDIPEDVLKPTPSTPSETPVTPEVAARVPVPVKLESGATILTLYRDVRSVQEASKSCMAGSFARSLDWLNREYNIGLTENSQEIYDQLIESGVSVKGNPIGIDNNTYWILAKQNYTVTNMDNKIITTVWEPGGDRIIGGLPGILYESGDLLSWLAKKLKFGDVELLFSHLEGNHIVTVVGMYTDELTGDTYLKYRDDEVQGDDTRGDMAIKHIKFSMVDSKYYLSDYMPIIAAISEEMQSLMEPTISPSPTPLPETDSGLDSNSAVDSVLLELQDPHEDVVNCQTDEVVVNPTLDMQLIRVRNEGERTYLDIETSVSPSEGVQVTTYAVFQSPDKSETNSDERVLIRVKVDGGKITEVGILNVETGQVDPEGVEGYFDFENSTLEISFFSQIISEPGFFLMSLQTIQDGPPCNIDRAESDISIVFSNK